MHDFLTNPAYAGAFVYGRTRSTSSSMIRPGASSQSVEVPVEQWSVCIPDHHPGYVSWDEYLATASGCERT